MGISPLAAQLRRSGYLRLSWLTGPMGISPSAGQLRRSGYLRCDREEGVDQPNGHSPSAGHLRRKGLLFGPLGGRLPRAGGGLGVRTWLEVAGRVVIPGVVRDSHYGYY